MLHEPQPDQMALLIRDIRESFRNWRFWIYLGWNDIAKQYRRSIIGPVWITLNTALFIVAFGLLGSQLFRMPIEEYLPYFCAGQILFSFLSALINEGCQSYISADAFLKQSPYPKFAFVLRVVWRNTLLLAHNMVVVFVVLAWAGYLAKVTWLAFVAALALTLVCATLVVAIFGALATRFRDIPMIVSSIMQISFFVTPVMWRPDQLTERAKWLVRLNPLAGFLEILRAPLLGGQASNQAWATVFGMLVLLLFLFALLYRFARRRIVYWL
jgi:ABC-type polysaccharide/polyol phosphate export permease